MKKNRFIFLALSLVFAQTACTTHKKNTVANVADNNFNSTLWMQTSAEYVANSVQTYQTACRNLSRVLADNHQSAAIEQTSSFQKLPPAIILDIDETVLDNSRYQARLVQKNETWSPLSWDKWIALKHSEAIPGAVDFIHQAQQQHINIFFVTNRACKQRPDNSDRCPQKQDTIDNLKTIGINQVMPDHVLLQHDTLTQDSEKNWTSEKKSRREYLARNYHIIMLFGDNLSDFIADVRKKTTIQRRLQLTYKNRFRWGYQWYMLTNPTYGSWLNILKKPRIYYFKNY